MGGTALRPRSKGASLVARDCVFCRRIAEGSVLTRNALAVAFADSYPVSPGHALIVPTRHEPDFFALSTTEQRAVYALLSRLKGLIDEEHEPDGYNVGLNVGNAAGQTVAHAHLHVIPRYRGDVVDPRGGVRWVLPAHAAYWGADT